MMKKFFALLLAAGMLFSLAACGETPASGEDAPNRYYDESTGLLLTYPGVFSSSGTLTEDGKMDFYTLWDTGFHYWTEPNEQGLTPSVFLQTQTVTESAELDGNVVIAWGEGADPSGNPVPIAYYWVVDTDFIAHVTIFCPDQEEAVYWYNEFRNGAFYLENAAGTEAVG